MPAPERVARRHIDQLLEAAGWQVQDHTQLNLGASFGVAVREFPIKGAGYADYLLFVDRKAVGAIEAKKEGITLGAISEQTEKYLAHFPTEIPHHQSPLPFSYESTGVETYFRDLRDLDSRSRRVFAFHKPQQLSEWINSSDTLRDRLQRMPSLPKGQLYDCQFDAITNLEESFHSNKPHALIQMATGSGKTFTAVSFCYRLIKFANAKRILFLVDRSNLGEQTEKEFQQYVTPDDGRKFTELYNVQRLSTNAIEPVNRVCISTIQRVYSMLRGTELDEENEQASQYEQAPSTQKPLEVGYNPKIPVEDFDFIVIDECHRSIYNLWRQVLEYFDAFLVGLTATPSKQTIGFFNQNLVMEYPHERAVADGVNVGYQIYRIKTQISEKGSRVDAGHFVTRRDKRTRKERIEALDEEFEYEAIQLDRSVLAPSQIRTVIRTFKEKLLTEIFPGRQTVLKTLIFAKDDNHAEEILHIVREEFGKGNEFCKKITYRSHEKPKDLITAFRNSYDPRIAVSVDMIATGTDIKPLECLLFMRDVRSSVYFDQMKGRGTRIIGKTDLQAVTPDAVHKTHFVVVDAVGVTETDKTDTKPLDTKPGVSFERLLGGIPLGVRDEETLSTLAGRLARLDRAIDPKDQKQIAEAAGRPLRSLINSLLDAIDTAKQLQKAKELFDTDPPTDEQRESATKQLVTLACEPFDDPNVRNTILEIKERNEITIDTESIDRVLYAGADEATEDVAAKVVKSFEQFIADNKDEITALQIFYNQPFGQRHFTLKQIRDLAEAIKRPPYFLTTEKLWLAYRKLEQDKVKGVGEQRLLTDVISLVRHAIGEEDVLVPFREIVSARFDQWLTQHSFSDEQLDWLGMIKRHVVTSLTIEMEDLELAPFNEKGGRFKAIQVFGKDELRAVLEEINETVAA